MYLMIHPDVCLIPIKEEMKEKRSTCCTYRKSTVCTRGGHSYHYTTDVTLCLFGPSDAYAINSGEVFVDLALICVLSVLLCD